MQLKAKDLGGGALVERIQGAITEILADITNINTEPKAKRSITAKITFAPNEERNGCSFEIDVKTKLGGPKVVDGVIRIGVDHGTGEIDALEISQRSLFPEQQGDIEGVENLNDHRENQS